MNPLLKFAIIITSFFIAFLILWHYVNKRASKRSQRQFFEVIEDKILMCETENDLYSDDLYSRMTIFQHDMLYDDTGKKYWDKLSKLKSDAHAYFRRKRQSDCVSKKQ